MNPEKRQMLRIKLEQKRDELLTVQDSQDEAGRPVELDQSRVGRLSRMDALQGQQMALESARRGKKQLLKIESALRRLDAEDFGYCVECGEEIAEPRLAADPSHTHCIHCAD
jgi:DnaK suppressor protein